MDAPEQTLPGYLSDVLGLEVEEGRYQPPPSLPQFLRQRYAFSTLTAEGRRFLVVRPREANSVRPAALEKHLRRVPLEDVEGVCVLAISLPRYVRKRLVERRIPFVVPGVQVYWPALGLIVHPREARPMPAEVDHLRPASQAVVLLALTGRLTGEVALQELADTLGYSAMTLSRAISEIAAAGIGAVVSQRGRKRVLRFESAGRDLWQRARPKMRNPVAKVITLPEQSIRRESLPLAGESALAARSMLAPPAIPVVAIAQKGWQCLRRQGVEPVALADAGTCQVEVWRYDPALFSEGRCVDVFSLYLSLQQESDERVQGALDELIEGYEWS